MSKRARPSAPPAVRPPASPAPPQAALLTRLLQVVLTAAALPRLWLAFNDHGMFHPDEIHQSIEQAHRLVFGYGSIPWEFVHGARSWLFPGLLAGVLKLLSLVGVDDALTLVAWSKVFMVALALVAIGAAMRLAWDLAGPRAALLTGVLLAVAPPVLFFTNRCTTEGASAPLVALGALWLYGQRRRAGWAGLCVATAVFLRYQNGVLLAGFWLTLLAAGRKQEARQYLKAAVLVGVLLGLVLDGLTWGRPLQSFWAYVQFNFVEEGANIFGVEPWWFYATASFRSFGPTLMLMLAAVAAAYGGVAERATRPWVLVLGAYLLLHSYVPHKEYRFLVPILPLFLVAVGVGGSRILDRFIDEDDQALPNVLNGRRWAAAGAVSAVIVLVLATRARQLTFRDLVAADASDPPSVWFWYDDHARLLASAGRRPDACGVAMLGMPMGLLISSAGYTYLHRDVPLTVYGKTDPSQAAAITAGCNYLVAAAGSRLPGYVIVDRVGSGALFRREGPCGAPPPEYRREWPRPETPKETATAVR